jgi:murein DD-endopeptidase MepM/ murein hydrolase activator NlpD
MQIRRKPWWKRSWFAAPIAILIVVVLWIDPFLRHPLEAMRLLRMSPPVLLAVPVDFVLPGNLNDTWGAARTEGRLHEGIDIFAPRGTPVRSTTEGIVIRRGWNRLGGRRVLVLGPGWTSHYYAHLEAYARLEPGDIVEPGDVLGLVGTSGNADGTPAHLHYGVYRWTGGAVDPFPLLVPPHARESEVSTRAAAAPSAPPPLR